MSKCQCQHFQMAICLGNYNKGLCNIYIFWHHSVNQMILLTFVNSFYSRVFHNSYNQNYPIEIGQGVGNNGIVLIFLFMFEKIT